MTNTLQNNFTSGIVSPKLWGQYNSSVYHSGCAKLENFRILEQGGVSRRYPTKYVNTIESTSARLIPFEINDSLSFIVELANQTIKVWRVSNNTLTLVSFNGVTNLTFTQLGFYPYSSAVLEEVQFAQGLREYQDANNQTVCSMILVLTQRANPPVIFEYIPASDMIAVPYQLTHSNAIFSHYTEGSITVEYEATKSFLTVNDYPSCVFYYASRLWFASSKNHPYRLWASRPFKAFSFEMVDYVETVDDVTTSDDIIEAIESGDDTLTISTTVENTEVIREDNALLLEVGSAKNDEIKWISSMGNAIVVGTSSAEWIMSGSINGLNQSIYQASAYGSSSVQPAMAGNDLIFAQSGSKKARAYIGSESGYSCTDLNFICDEILSSGIKHFAWKRVPDPTLYCVLGDGNLAVLFYDRQYSLQGWALWSLDSDVLDIAVLSNTTGQRVYVLSKHNSTRVIEYFDESETVFIDNKSSSTGALYNIPFDSKLETCTYERTSSTDGSSLGKKKRIYQAKVRVLNTTQIKGGYYWGSSQAEYENTFNTSNQNPYGIDDFSMTLAGGYQKYVSFKLSSVGTSPLTVDAISLMVEVE